MKQKAMITPPVVGASSLLVIFAVLCLTVFAMLSISTVQADGRLSDSAAAAITGYYQADCQAEKILSTLRSGHCPAGVTRDGNVYTYACPISDTQVLAVEVTVEQDTYKILRWQAVSAVNWQADDKLPIWDGQS